VSRRTFRCIDGHTAGNPVRLVVEGAPELNGGSMSQLRQDFIARFDWIRRGLMFEPRGHDMMSGGFLYPPFDAASDAAILFMETSGALPMCGHGTIGILTFGLEAGLIRAREEGRLRVEVPAGVLEVEFAREGEKVAWVRLTNVPSFVAAAAVEVELPELGPLSLDIAYGGNFYAIVEPQGGYLGLDALGAAALARLGRELRSRVREAVEPVHPEDSTIRGVSHVLWADEAKGEGADGRNAVFYGEKAIDRSPCGTGTSARLAHLWSQGRLQVGQPFVHESYIGSRFIGRIESETRVGDLPAIRPSVQGSAWQTGLNTIWIDDDEPFPEGFTVL
jgi:4-hydroxyproline epimerase